MFCLTLKEPRYLGTACSGSEFYLKHLVIELIIYPCVVLSE